MPFLSFDHLFQYSEEYTDETLAMAKSHIEQMVANYGGTNIYGPFEDIFGKEERFCFSKIVRNGTVSK